MPEIKFTVQAEKLLRKLSQVDRQKALAKISLLSFPFYLNNNIKKLTNLDNTYRLRVGNIRVVFEFNARQDIIWITLIGYRKDVYKLLQN